MKKRIKENPLRFVTHLFVGIALVIPILAILIYVCLNVRVGEYCNGVFFNGVRPSLIITNSMEPNIQVNSIVLVKDVPFSDIDLDSIIRYNSDSGISVVHRVVAVGDGELVTKGDNNKYIDDELITPEKYTGEIVEIHNELAPLVTKIFGTFDMNNLAYSTSRLAMGFIIGALIVAAIVLAFYYLFEIISINLFWNKKRAKLENSIAWMESLVTIDTFNDIVDKYQEALKTSNRVKRVRIYFAYRKYYDTLCTLEKKNKKVERSRKRLSRLIDNKH